MIKPIIKDFSGVSNTETKTVVKDDKPNEKSSQENAASNTQATGSNATAPNQTVGSSQMQVGGSHEESKNRFAVLQEQLDFAKGKSVISRTLEDNKDV